MNMKRFRENNMHSALRRVREELGDNAVIISSNQDSRGVEIVAATDYDAVANGDYIVNTNLSVQDKSKAVNEQTPIYNDIRSTEPIHNDFDTSKLQDEINQLRNIIESQTEIISWNKLINQNTLARRILQKLSISGFGYNLSKCLLDQVKQFDNFDIAWAHITKSIERGISLTKENIIDKGGVVALVGPTGVGKTTTIAKIAAEYSLRHGSHDIALISTDHYRIGAHDQISTYGSILNVPVIAANNKQELQNALKIVKNKKLVLIDTAGLCQRDRRVLDIMNTLYELTTDVNTYLVVSANSQLCVQKEIINKFMPKQLNGVVISKTDEAIQIGGILTVLIEHKLPIAFETTGQRVPEDIVRPSQSGLLKKAVFLGNKYGNMESIHPTELYSELVEND